METKLRLVPSDSVDADSGEVEIPFLPLPPKRCKFRVGSNGRGALNGQNMSEDRGAVTAEYAIIIMAAVAFAGLLVAILRSPEVQALLLQLVQDALGAAG